MVKRPLIDRVYERLTGARVWRKLDRGQDIFYDMRYSLPQTRIDCIFDVGANTGQSAVQYLKRFPAASLYCFEPVSSAFRELQQRFGGRPVHLLPIALTSQSGTGHMRLADVSTMHMLTSAPEDRSEPVQMQTLDDFCDEREVKRISFLKIDTEGHDLEVLKGGKKLLEAGKVDIIQVEAGMNVSNDWHVPFKQLNSHLEDAGYSLFALYEQKREWPTKQPHLRRTNPVYISRSVIQGNTA